MAPTDQQLHVFLNETPMGTTIPGQPFQCFRFATGDGGGLCGRSPFYPPGENQWGRLARLYDMVSFIPYAERRKDCRFAMKIGGYYKDAQIQSRHFTKMARSCEFASQELIDTIAEMAGRIPKAAKTVKAELDQQGIRHAVLGQLVKGIHQRAETTLKNTQKI